MTWLDPYNYRVPITVPAANIPENLNNFIVPVKAHLDHDTNNNIQFTKDDGITLINQDVIQAEGNHVHAFAQLNLINNTDTTMYLYYGI